MEESAEKKFLGMDAVMVAVLGLFLTILSVVIVLAMFAFNTIRADNARIEASIAASRAEQKADIEALRAEQKADVDKLEASIEALRAEQRADIDMLSDKVDALDDNLDARLDEIEREQARMQGAVEVLRGQQAPNP